VCGQLSSENALSTHIRKYIASGQSGREFMVGAVILTILLMALLSTGCGHPKQARTSVPPPPLPEPSSTESTSRPEGAAKNDRLPGAVEDEADLAEPTIPADAVPIATETGTASWYGPPYHNRRGSNGEIYNMHAMTAAHRTLPLGSIVRVTNLKTEHTALVRITDRGPFIPGRILDLSLAAAHKVDVYLPGTAEVKVEVMQAPVPLATGGKWAVQIGSFAHEREASKFADHLTHRYQTAKVRHFGSPAGDWWVRVRVLDDDRKRAQQLAAETATQEGAVFLVRLD
jgi:rare lipoprotein A